MIADRFLMIGVTLALIVDFVLQGDLTRSHLLQLFIVMSREIITFPFALISFVSRKPIPHARFIGKLTTFLQGIAVPSIILSSLYPIFSYSWYLSIITSIIGIFSAIFYINDLNKEGVR